MKRTLLFALTALPVIAGGEAAAQVFPQASTEASPIIYKINSYSRGGSITEVDLSDNNTYNLQHVNFSANSFWRLESIADNANGGVYIYNAATGKAIGENRIMSADSPATYYILSNGVNKEGVAISTTNPISSGSCLDANNNNSGIGTYDPRTNDWEGTTWTFEPVAAGKFILTPATQSTTDKTNIDNQTTKYYTFASDVITLPAATNKLRFTVMTAANGGGNMALYNGHPFFTLAEFNLYDANGNAITYTSDQITTNAQQSTEGPLAGICDGNNKTFFHSSYSGTVDGFHYIEITLSEAVSSFKFSFESRNLNNVPTSMVISSASDITSFENAKAEAEKDLEETEKEEAREALQAAITNANNAAEGTELNKYTKGDAFKAALTAAQETVANTSATTESLTSATTSLKTAVANAINLPKDGQFIRVRATSDSRPDMPYLSSENITFTVNGGQQQRAVYSPTGKEGEGEATTIFYYKDGKLLAYANGLYLGATEKNMLAYNGVIDGIDVSFAAAANGTIGCYNVRYNNDARYLYTQQGTVDGTTAYYTDGAGKTGAEGSAGYNFWLEEVETLPVTISSAGYASFYTPVALTIPAESGLEVYTGNVNTTDNTLELTAVNGTLPAGSAVILKGAEGKYDFAITTSDATASNGSLTGQAATINKDAAATNIYTLQAPAAGVGMYKYTGTTLAGFKAYLQTTGASAVAGFRFGGTTTGIESILNTADGKAPAAVYDLQGRRVEKAGKGLYIINGQKVLFK